VREFFFLKDEVWEEIEQPDRGDIAGMAGQVFVVQRSEEAVEAHCAEEWRRRR